MDTNPLASVRHLALDMDGTIYRGGTLFDFTRPFLARMDAMGIGYTFLTNNASKSVQDYIRHLERFGIAATRDRLCTSSLTTIDYLRRRWPEAKRLYLLGTPSLCAELAEAGFTVVSEADEPDAVVVSFDMTLTYARLCRTAWWIQRGKPYVATHPDRVCPTDLPTVLVDCGAICDCLRSATGRAPDAVLGKPEPSMLTGILARQGLAPHELAMVGDRLYTDMAMARRAGVLGVLVLTGEASAEDARRCPDPPDLVVPSLRELGERIAQSREER
jgi:NagD protein